MIIKWTGGGKCHAFSNSSLVLNQTPGLGLKLIILKLRTLRYKALLASQNRYGLIFIMRVLCINKRSHLYESYSIW